MREERGWSLLAAKVNARTVMEREEESLQCVPGYEFRPLRGDKILLVKI